MSAAEVQVRRAAPADDEARDAFVAATDGGTCFHRSAWGRAVEHVFRHERRDLLAWRDRELCGVLPLFRCRGLTGGARLISVPYAVYGGPVASDPDAEAALVAAAAAMADSERAAHVELRSVRAPAACAEWPASELYATFLQDLPERPEDVLGTIPKKARAEARKARQRHGLELVEGIWYLEDLYRMFHRNKRSLGSPALPLAFFHALAEELGPDCVVHLVRREREPLAAVMSFRDGDVLRSYYSGTAEGVDRTYSASNFMYLALREWSVEQGFGVFDFGRSRVNSGPYAFKRHQGFEPIPLEYRYHLVRGGLPSLNPSNPRTKILQDTWRRLPPWATARLSDRLARYLP